MTWFLVPSVFGLALAERLPGLRFRAAPLARPQAATDALWLLTSWVLLGVLTTPPVVAAAVWAGAASGLGDVWNAVAPVAQVVVALVALDLGNYVAHWLMHRVDVLWTFHAVHHSITHLDWLATFRSHLLEQLLRRGVAAALLIAAGIPPRAVALAAGVFLVWAIANHSNVRLPLAGLEWLLITPRLHRLHHVPATSERNLGTVFSCWDRLRGTLVRADAPADVRFGFPRQPASYPQDWLGQVVAPWRQAV
jgi:sterol desaturase/sphingolipid hydroxylase (fatty acid hydroxylase superfamily)